MTVKLSIGRIQSNLKLVSAKHWTYQTISEYIHACVMILPIEEYKTLNQRYLAYRRCCQILRRFFSLQEKGITVKLSMGIIESNLKLPFRENIRYVLL